MAFTCLAYGQMEVPELTLGPKPDPLIITPPNYAPTGLLRWYGNPKSTPTESVDEMAWVPDGTRMFTGPGVSGPRRHAWKPGPSGTSVEMEGEINMSGPLVVSEDGRWIFGPCHLPDNHMPRLELHRADTLEGVWSLDGSYDEIETGAFSKDGKWLALVHQIYRGQGIDRQVYISILDAATGTRVQVLHPRSGWREFDGFGIPRFDVAFSDDALVLHPCYDEEHRIKRYPIATWKMEFASDALHADAQKHMLLSKDGRWLVLWGSEAYSVFEFSGGAYQERFAGEAWTAENEDERFNSIRLSPDSTTLVLSGCGKHKVIRLSDRMVLHDGADNCLCGEFSPNGRIFWNKCQPFRSIDTRIWQSILGPYEQHNQEITQLVFSPDGRMLASASFESLRLWSTEREAPPLKLVSPRKPARYRSMAWSKDGHELLGGDGKDFCKWRISDINKTTREVKGSVLFTSPPWRVDTLRFQDLYLIPKTGACLLTQSNSRSILWETRNPSTPSVVKRLEGSGYPQSRITFLPDGTEFFYLEDEHSDCKVVAHRLPDGNVRRLAMGTRGYLAGMIPGGDLVVVSHNKITFVDPKTLQPRERVIAPPGQMYFQTLFPKASAVSPDGKWLYCLVNEQVVRQRLAMQDEFPALVNLQQNGEIIRLAPHLAKMTTTVFSSDSSKLAVGHQSGLVSLWDVATLAKSSPALPPSQDGSRPPQSQQRVVTSHTSKPIPWSSEWPATSRKTDDGDTRGYSNNGSVLGVESEADMGRLLVNGAEPKVLAGRSVFNEGTSQVSPTSAPTYGFRGEVEMSTPDGNVRIHRQLRGNSRAGLKWFDTFENLSEEPQAVTLSYHHKMGGTINDLQVMHRKPTLFGEGHLSADGPIHSASMITRLGGVSRFSGIKFSSASPPLLPVVRWLETERALVTEWTLRLEAFEKRAIMLEMSHRRLEDEHETGHGIMSGALTWGFSGDFLLHRLPLMVNFAPITPKSTERGFDTQLGERQQEKFAKEREMKATGLDEDGYKKDVMGFRWRLTDSPASGMGAEFGALRIFELRMDGHPMTFFESSSTELPGKAPKHRAQFSGFNSPVKVLRENQWKEADSVFATHDEVVNTGATPVKCQLQLLVVAQQYFERIEDGQGKVLDLTAPTPISSFGGKLAIVSPGETKASILLSLGNPAAKYGAKVRLAANRGLIIAYDLELAPGERVPLMHLAAQRPLNVYKNTQEAFDELGTPSPSQRSTEADLASPANWSATP